MKALTSKSVGTEPSSYEKRIYRAAVSQRLRNAVLREMSTRGISCGGKGGRCIGPCASFLLILGITSSWKPEDPVRPVQVLPCFVDHLDPSRGPTQHCIVALLLVNGEKATD